jgi:hypothetical protein
MTFLCVNNSNHLIVKIIRVFLIGFLKISDKL